MGDNFEKLKMLERGASKAPWRTHLVDDTSIIDANRNPVASTFPDGGVDDDVDFHAPVEQMERDAAFIVAARNHIPELIVERERLREALRPFARVAEHDIGDDETDGDRFLPIVDRRHARAPLLTVGDLRRALAALKEPTDA